MKEVLILGKNSRLWKILRPTASFDYDEFSHADIGLFSANKMYDSAIIFSYASTRNGNAELLTTLSMYTKRIIYISSISVEYAEDGHSYNYPNIKLFCEEFLAAKKNNSLSILRLGLVLETYAFKKLTGTYGITNIEKLSMHLAELVTKGESKVPYVDIIDYPIKSKVERVIYSLYKPLVKPNMLLFIVTRFFDIFLKKLGYTWYGYSEKK